MRSDRRQRIDRRRERPSPPSPGVVRARGGGSEVSGRQPQVARATGKAFTQSHPRSAEQRGHPINPSRRHLENHIDHVQTAEQLPRMLKKVFKPRVTPLIPGLPILRIKRQQPRRDKLTHPTMGSQLRPIPIRHAQTQMLPQHIERVPKQRMRIRLNPLQTSQFPLPKRL